jgi:hypothetical protein
MAIQQGYSSRFLLKSGAEIAKIKASNTFILSLIPSWATSDGEKG